MGPVVVVLAASLGSAQAAELPSFCSAYPPAPRPVAVQPRLLLGGTADLRNGRAGNRIPAPPPLLPPPLVDERCTKAAQKFEPARRSPRYSAHMTQDLAVALSTLA